MAVEFSIKRQRRKTLALHVLEDASVEVRAPKWVAKRDIELFVRQRSQWVLDQQHKRRQQLAAKPGFTQGQKHPYMGQHYPLLIAASASNHVSFQASAINIAAKKTGSPELIESILKEGYRAQAKKHFAERLKHFFPQLPITSEMPELKLRYMRSRWGSCSSRNIITLNVELIKYPSACIDYVVVHELCHLLEMNHSPRFYRHLASIMPDWRQREIQLEQLAKAG